MRVATQFLWLGLYHYYIGQIGDLEKGWRKRIVSVAFTFLFLLPGQIDFCIEHEGWKKLGVWLRPGGWLFVTLILFLFLLFYDEKPLKRQWWKALWPGGLLFLCSLAPGTEMLALNGIVMAAFLLLLAWERGCLRLWLGLLLAAVYGLLGLYAVFLGGAGGGGGNRIGGNPQTNQTLLLSGILLLEALLFFSLEGALYSYQRRYAAQTEAFLQDVLSHQYAEMKEIYLNMRGWRHDYHNHMQVMKVQLAKGKLEELWRYLEELEQSLDSVDTSIKCGNQMVDAILNSKLTLAKKKNVKVNCKAVLPKLLSVEDVEMCVLLGNLLDNALEACEKIGQEQRFLRIYMAVNGEQLYLSVQNSAKEELNFNERHYITEKRGNHGLGMKRVKALTDKYGGYLALASEPGIFAAEVTLPLTKATAG